MFLVPARGKAGMLAALLELGWAELEHVFLEYRSGCVGRTEL